MEIWDLYDKNRNKLDMNIKRGDKVPNNCYHLAVKICIFNSKGEMLIQQRSLEKRDYPEYWDLTACGSAISGETSEMAIKREVQEELGINIGEEHLVPFLTIYDKVWFADIFIVKKSVNIAELKLQKSEVKAVKWASKEEILELIKNYQFIPFKTYQQDMSNLIEMIFDEMNQNK